MTVDVSVFIKKIISAYVNLMIFVLNVSFTILNLIIVTNVSREENVFKMIQRIPMISDVFVHRVIKEIVVNLISKHLVSLSIHFLFVIQH
jgi:hypothetical protein